MEARRTRRIEADTDALWAVIEDPHHFPRWWPGVIRVEGVSGDRFTHVYTTKKGRTVRIDFRVLENDAPDAGSPGHRAWEQEIPGTPFERVLREAITEIWLAPADGGAARVTLAQRQKLRGYSRTGGWMLRRATRARLEEALDGLERILA
jgi:carbon monoxide dehydrogenase subunit G